MSVPPTLAPNHERMLRDSAIDREVIKERGYFTAYTKVQLRELGFPESQRRAPSLVIPIYNPSGELASYQIRPDSPRLNRDGKLNKYESPAKSRVIIDVPPRAKEWLRDRDMPLFITEGSKKADAAVSAGLCCVALLGVWGWRDSDGALPDWEYIGTKGRRVYIVFDSDVMEKEPVHQALTRQKAFLEQRGADVRVVYLPPGEGAAKVGLDDYLAAGNTPRDLMALAEGQIRKPRFEDPRPPAPPKVKSRTLDEVVAAFRKHLHIPDDGAVKATLAAYAANRMPGAPVWLLLVGPPSGGKTEALMPLLAMHDVRLCSVLTEGSLLSGTAQKEHAEGAKGGLLREIGDFGYLMLKDFTSVLAMNRDSRGIVLAALREVYDGAWTRHVGTDGGKTLAWTGKIGLIGGCTPAIDAHHAVMAALGERFLLYRLPPVDEDLLSGSSLSQVDGKGFQKELGEAVAGLLSNLPAEIPVPALTESETEYIKRLAILTVRARSAVERDTGASKEITLVPEPEAPGRLVQALYRLFAGLLAIGCEREEAWRVIRHTALSSMPALRRRALELLTGESGWLRTSIVANELEHPTNTTLRTLEDLFVHRLIERSVEGGGEPGQGKAYTWRITERARATLDSPLPTFTQIQEGISNDTYTSSEDTSSLTPSPDFGERCPEPEPEHPCQWPDHRGNTWLRSDGALMCGVCRPNPSAGAGLTTVGAAGGAER